MAAIKILGKEDIIAAYLRSLGFGGQDLPKIVKAVAELLDFQSADGDELIDKIDAVLLKIARKSFPDSPLEDEQLLAEFKLCFLLCNGAAQCTVQSIRKLRLPTELTQTLRKKASARGKGRKNDASFRFYQPAENPPPAC